MDISLIARMSSKLLILYHQNEPIPFSRYLAPNVMWFGPGVGHVLSGKDNIIRVWESAERPVPLNINEPEVHAIALGSHACNVVMSFTAAMRFASGEEAPVFRRIMLSWIETTASSTPQVVLVQSSNLYLPNDEKRIFPV